MKKIKNPYLYLWGKLFTKDKGIEKVISFNFDSTSSGEFDFSIRYLSNIKMIYIPYHFKNVDSTISLWDIIYYLKESRFIKDNELEIYKELVDKETIKPFVLDKENISNKELFEVKSSSLYYKTSKLIDLRIFIDNVCNELIDNPLRTNTDSLYTHYYIG